jgi:excinuclease UvrABC nuclease subunit
MPSGRAVSPRSPLLQTSTNRAHVARLRAVARSLPEQPGVYLWKDAQGRTLYVGKAVNLRARVSSYFSAAQHNRRIRQLIADAVTIEHEVTSTELEALFRESALIKREQPHYNRALKQSHPLFYLRLDINREDPWIETARQVQSDGALYFGPFRSWSILRETIAYLHDLLPLRKCTRMNPRCRPCIYFQMGTCAAPPLGGEHRARHREAMARLFSLLDGVSDDLLRWLEHKRDVLVRSLLFERAAEVQERIETLHELLRQQTILEAAVQCRAVLIRTPEKLLLVAYGHVVSTRDVGAEQREIEQWVAAHEVIFRHLRDQPHDADAPIVLERWLTRHRQRVRWAALIDDPKLTAQRIAYVLEGELGGPL